MCKILDVEPRDYHVILDFSHAQIEYLLMYLDRCEAKSDPDEPDWPAADKYVRKDFFPLLDKLSDQIKDQKK